MPTIAGTLPGMKILVGLLVLVLAAGCGGSGNQSAAEPASKTAGATSDPDAAWKAAVEQVRGEPMSATKWASYSGGIRTGKCKSDDMVTAVAVQIDIPSPFPMLNRIDIQYGCPDRLTEYDQAVALEANYLKRGKALCGPTKQLAERLAVAAKLSEPGPLTDAEILSAVCE